MAYRWGISVPVRACVGVWPCPRGAPSRSKPRGKPTAGRLARPHLAVKRDLLLLEVPSVLLVHQDLWRVVRKRPCLVGMRPCLVGTRPCLLGKRPRLIGKVSARISLEVTVVGWKVFGRELVGSACRGRPGAGFLGSHEASDPPELRSGPRMGDPPPPAGTPGWAMGRRPHMGQDLAPWGMGSNI